MTNATSKNATVSAKVQSRIDSFNRQLAREVFVITKQLARQIYDDECNKHLTGFEMEMLHAELDKLVQAAKPLPTESSIREELSTLNHPDDLRATIGDILSELKTDQRLDPKTRTELSDVAKTFYPSLDETSIDQMFDRATRKSVVAAQIIKILTSDTRVNKRRRTALFAHLKARIAEFLESNDEASAFMDEELAKYQKAPTTTLVPEAYDPPEEAILDRIELLRQQMEANGIETDNEGLRTEAIRQLTHERMQKAA